MTRTLLIIALAGCVTTLPGQTSEQTITGVLMDASCPAIGRSADSAENQVKHNGQTGANEQSTLGETARTKTETESRDLKVYDSKKTSSDQSEQDAGNNPGTNVAALQAQEKEVTRSVSSATAGPSQASATGTTGAATSTAPPQSGNVQSLSSVQGPGASNSAATSATGERSRTAPVRTTVGEKYKACIAKPTTTAFAIHSDGKLYVLDADSNKMVQEQMRNEAFQASMSDKSGAPQWLSVTVVGTASDDTLSITSVRK